MLKSFIDSRLCPEADEDMLMSEYTYCCSRDGTTPEVSSFSMFSLVPNVMILFAISTSIYQFDAVADFVG